MSSSNRLNDADFWSEQYTLGKTKWNIGYVTPPLKAYFDQIHNKEINILVPGAGYGWEAGYLFESGFKNVFALDFANTARKVFFDHHPDFPQKNHLLEDFFLHQGQYDLIVEHTFFSGIDKEMRNRYVEKVAELLLSDGKMVGLFFNHEFQMQGPPFGGDAETYTQLFGEKFNLLLMENAYNSIKPRAGRELFCIFEKK